MEAITGFFTAHPIVFKVMIVILIIVVVYLLFKQFLKLSLVLFLIALAGAGYHYYNSPQKMSDDVHKLKSSGEKLKSFYKDSKELISKGKNTTGDINKLLDDAKDKAGK